MTRDTKVGLVLVGSFVLLVGVVVATRMFRGESPSDATVAVAPAGRDDGELQEEKGPPPRPKKKEGEKAPGLLPVSALNVPSASAPTPKGPAASVPSVPPPPPPPPTREKPPAVSLPPDSPTPPKLDPSEQQRTLEALARAAVDPPAAIPGKPFDLPPAPPPSTAVEPKVEAPAPPPASVPPTPSAVAPAPTAPKEKSGFDFPPLPAGPGATPPPAAPVSPPGTVNLPPPIAPPPKGPAPISPPKIDVPAPSPGSPPAVPGPVAPAPATVVPAPAGPPSTAGPSSPLPPIPAPPNFGPADPEPMPPPTVVVPRKETTPTPAPVIPAPPVMAPPAGNPPAGNPLPPPAPPIGVPPLGAPPQTNLPPVRSVDIEPYQVRPGDDSFQGVSRRVYGSDRYARALQRFNQEHPLAEEGIRRGAAALQSGQRIFLPPREILESKYATLLDGASAAPPRAPTSPPMTATPVATPPVSLGTPPRAVPSTPTSDEVKSYRVGGNGQYIIEIAQQTLGDGRRWAEIYRLNPTIRPEQVIPPGTELKIPASVRRP